MSLVHVFNGIFFLIASNFVRELKAEYTNIWAVEIEGGNAEADRLAHSHGFVNTGKILFDYYNFVYKKPLKDREQPESDVLDALLSNPSVKWAEQQELKEYSYLSQYESMFNDSKWPEQWYMNRIDGPTYNIIAAWQKGYTGKGIVVAVVDDGLSPNHTELKNNYFPSASYDFVENDMNPNGSLGHGTNCAGVIAGVADNNFCGVGIAYNVSLAGIRLFAGAKATDVLEAKALSHKKDLIDIYSNSWGPGDKGLEVEGPGHLTKKALENGVSQGRKGRGSIFVFAAGNGGVLSKDSCSYDGYVNSIYTIAISGMNKDGTIPSYGERCPGIMAVTYSYQHLGQQDSAPVFTAGKNDGCINNFGSSSAAAAMASGLIALALQANGDLGWRDVQHVVIRSARPNPYNFPPDGWITNAANLTAHDYLGFGLMDANLMVKNAESWKSVPEQNQCMISGPDTNTIIPSDQTEVSVEVPMGSWPNECGGEQDRIKFLEHVEIRVNLNYTLRGDLVIDLVSPSGTVSAMTHYRTIDSAAKYTNLTNWVIMTLHFWGEQPDGTWRLKLRNSQPQNKNTGILFNWAIIIHGTLTDPLEGNPHVTPPSVPSILPTNPSISPTSDQTPKALSGGVIAGVVIASVIGVVLLSAAGYFVYKKIGNFT